MKGNSLNIEKHLAEDAQNIFIDEDFKKNLKKKLLSMDRGNKYKRYSKPRYIRAASIAAAIAIAGTSVFGAGNLYMGHLAAMRLQQSQKKSAVNAGIITTLQNNKDVGLIQKSEEKAKNFSTNDNSSKNEPSGTKPSGSSAGAQNEKASYDSSTQNQGSQGSLRSNTNTGNGGTIKKNTPSNGEKQSPSSASGTTAASAGKASDKSGSQKNDGMQRIETTLAMVSGKYMINSIKAEKTETVEKLPEEYGSLSPEDSMKLPLANNEKIAFEKEGTVYMILPSTKKVVTVDSGKTPKVYEPINIVSYIKEEPSKEENKPAAGSVWIFDGNSAEKYNILTCSDGKYTYMNTFWSETGKELYVLAHNNFTGNYEIIKVMVSIA